MLRYSAISLRIVANFSSMMEYSFQLCIIILLRRIAHI